MSQNLLEKEAERKVNYPDNTVEPEVGKLVKRVQFEHIPKFNLKIWVLEKRWGSYRNNVYKYGVEDLVNDNLDKDEYILMGDKKDKIETIKKVFESARIKNKWYHVEKKFDDNGDLVELYIPTESEYTDNTPVADKSELIDIADYLNLDAHELRTAELKIDARNKFSRDYRSVTKHDFSIDTGEEYDNGEDDRINIQKTNVNNKLRNMVTDDDGNLKDLIENVLDYAEFLFCMSPIWILMISVAFSGLGKFLLFVIIVIIVLIIWSDGNNIGDEI